MKSENVLTRFLDKYLGRLMILLIVTSLGYLHYSDRKERRENPPPLVSAYVDQIILIKPGQYHIYFSKLHPTNTSRPLREITLYHNDNFNYHKSIVDDVPSDKPMWMEYYETGHFVSHANIHVHSGRSIQVAQRH